MALFLPISACLSDMHHHFSLSRFGGSSQALILSIRLTPAVFSSHLSGHGKVPDGRLCSFSLVPGKGAGILVGRREAWQKPAFLEV